MSARTFAIAILLAASIGSSAASARDQIDCEADKKSCAVVGAWIVKHNGAPFPWHMYVFNADGTMQQANPDAGHEKTSDSDGKGIWVAKAGRIRGKFVEITADRATRAYVGRGEISFDFVVAQDILTGTTSALFYDAEGKLVEGPIAVDMTGTRVTLP